MPLVEAFEIPGIRCWFYSDDHRPAHFHAGVPGEWEVRVYFLLDPPEMQSVFSVKHLPGKVRRQLLAAAADHRAELFVEWSDKVHLDNADA